MAYSIDFRKRTIVFIYEELFFAKLKEAFNSFPSTLAAWCYLFDESGQLTSRLIPGRPPTINIDSLIKAVTEKPDAYLYGDGAALRLSGCGGV
jgi:hypothetical protein